MTGRRLYRRCVAARDNGQRCRAHAIEDSDVCAFHAERGADVHPEVEPPEAALDEEEPQEPQEPQESQELQGPQASRSQHVTDVRAALRGEASASYERLAAFFDDAIAAEREVYGSCTKCGKRVPVAVPDWNARTNAVRLLLEQGYGKPAQTKDVPVERAEYKDVREMTLDEIHVEIAWLREKKYRNNPDGYAQVVRDEWEAEDAWRAQMAVTDPFGKYLPLSREEKLMQLAPSLRCVADIVERIEAGGAVPEAA